MKIRSMRAAYLLAVLAAFVVASGAGHKFGGYAIFFVYTALLGLPALVLATIVRRHFEKETPPSGPKEG